MKIRINEAIIHQFPRAELGYIVARLPQEPNNKRIAEYHEQAQAQAINNLGGYADNIGSHPVIESWRRAYSQFGFAQKDIKKDKMRSSVEALTRRAKNGSFPNIMPHVDLYNLASVKTMHPMAGYDLSRVSGDIELRHANEGDSMFTGLGMKASVTVNPKQIIYADQDGVICWLWNYRDCERTMINEKTRYAIFIIDSCERDKEIYSVSKSLAIFKGNLEEVGASIHTFGVLNADCLLSDLELPEDWELSSHEVIAPDLSECGNEITTDDTHIFHYANTGDLSSLKAVVQKNPEAVNTKDHLGSTVLHHAAVGGRIDCLRFILGLDNFNLHNECNNFGDTALHTAARHNVPLCAQILSEHVGAKDVVNQSGETPFAIAQSRSHFALFHSLQTQSNPSSSSQNLSSEGSAAVASGGSAAVASGGSAVLQCIK